MKSIILAAVAVSLTPLPAVAQNKAHPPIPRNEASWIKSNDNYPAAAIVARAQGRVAFTLTIDAQGKPYACRITQTSGNAALDETTCSIFSKNARFTPATDNDGTPVIGEWSGGMRWVLPG